jgi:hypothetical protein
MNRGQPSNRPSTRPTGRPGRHRLISVLATQLQMPYDETAAMSIEELDRRCRERQECSLLASVRAAEALIGACEEDGHRNLQGLGDDH